MTTTKETSDDGWNWADTLLILSCQYGWQAAGGHRGRHISNAPYHAVVDRSQRGVAFSKSAARDDILVFPDSTACILATQNVPLAMEVRW